jgi:O-antigen ligase
MGNTKNEIIQKPDLTSIKFMLVGFSVVTLVFNVNAYDPFNTPKLIFLILTSSWLLGHVINYFRNNRRGLSRFDFAVLISAFIFFLALTFALFTSSKLIVALIGDIQRRNGYLTYLSFLVLFLFASLFVNATNVKNILKTTTLLGLILGTYGVIQVTGNDFIAWNNPYNSMIATLGNPNFASSLLAIISLIMFLSLFIRNYPKSYKYISIIMLPLNLVAIVLSKSLQGIIVIGLGLAVYVLLQSIFVFKKFRLIVIFSFSSLVIFSVLGMLQKGPLVDYVYKTSVSIRGYYWRAAIKMFQDQPLTGVGLDNYGAFFKEFREVSYSLRFGYEITSTNAHNVFLQLFATGGILLGVSYLVLLILVAYAGIKVISQSTGDNQKVVILLFVAWLGVQAQSLISIDNIGIAIWGWLLGGALIGLYRSGQSSESKQVNAKLYLKKKSEINVFQTSFSILFLIPSLVVAFYLYSMERDTYLARGYVARDNPEFQAKLNDYANKVFSNPLADPQYKIAVSGYLIDAGMVEVGMVKVTELYASDDRNLQLLNYFAEVEEQSKNYTKAIQFRSQIQNIDPWNFNNLLLLGKLYKAEGDFSNMQRIKQIISEYAKGTDIAKIADTELQID